MVIFNYLKLLLVTILLLIANFSNADEGIVTYEGYETRKILTGSNSCSDVLKATLEYKRLKDSCISNCWFPYSCSSTIVKPNDLIYWSLEGNVDKNQTWRVISIDATENVSSSNEDLQNIIDDLAFLSGRGSEIGQIYITDFIITIAYLTAFILGLILALITLRQRI